MEEKKSIGLYVDGSLLERIDFFAKKHQSSRNKMINHLIQFGVDLYEENEDTDDVMWRLLERQCFESSNLELENSLKLRTTD